MLAKDSTGRSVQILHPMDDGCQTIAAGSNAVGRNANAFKSWTVAISVRVRSSGTVRLKLGGNAVTPGANDFILRYEDGPYHMSLEGKDASGTDKVKATYLGVLADSTAASVDVQELN